MFYACDINRAEKNSEPEEYEYAHTEEQKAAKNNLMGLMGKVDEVL